MLVVSLILAVLGSAVYVSLSHSLQDEVDRNLQSNGEDMVTKLREFNEGELRFDREGYQGRLFYLVMNTKGEVLANPQHVSVDAITLPFGFGSSSYYQTITIDGEPTRLYIRPIPNNRLVAGVLIAGQSLVPEEAGFWQAGR